MEKGGEVEEGRLAVAMRDFRNLRILNITGFSQLTIVRNHGW